MSDEKPPIYENVKCPDCEGPMISRTGKFGTFWGCMKFPACKGTRDSNGRSKQDREEYKIKKESEERGDEWPRNKEDNVSWNKKK